MPDDENDLGETVQKLSKDVETAYSDCKALSQVEALQYPELQYLLETAQRLYPAHRKDVVKRAQRDNFSKPAKSTELVVSLVAAMISGFKIRLYDNAIEYSQALDEKCSAFYEKMADNLVDNMREKNLRRPPTAHPKTALDAKALAGFFAVGVIPKSGDLSAYRMIMDAYDARYEQVKREADTLLEATKGTVLELDEARLSILAVLYNYGPLGKMGKMRMDYLNMEMFADKNGLHRDTAVKVMPSLASS